MRLIDLSFRYKIPLWGSALIVITTLGLSVSFMVWTYYDHKQDMLANSESLGRILAETIYPDLLHDDVWHAYEIIKAPYRDAVYRADFRTEGMIVLDGEHKVFVSSRPDTWRVLTPLARLGPAYADLESRLKAAPPSETVTWVTGEVILLVIPMVADDVDIGHLVMVHPADFYWPRFRELAWNALLITVLVLLVLLPINWRWGWRLAQPLIQLSARMDKLGVPHPGAAVSHNYPCRDELGQLFQAYDRMQTELAEKATLEQRMVKEERMAALGRLAAGIAHEINNPLGGLMTALDTVKHHARPDPVLARALPYLERGLAQVRDIVAALLVQAKARGRPLAGHDIEDVQTLLAQVARQADIEWTWDNRVGEVVDLPATQVRQVLINLVLNAVQAAGAGGWVAVRCGRTGHRLDIVVENDGAAIPDALMDHLFEPFTGLNEDGYGLGLWVTHQIVEQLGGRIAVESSDGHTCFRVELPEGDMTWPIESV